MKSFNGQEHFATERECHSEVSRGPVTLLDVDFAGSGRTHRRLDEFEYVRTDA